MIVPGQFLDGAMIITKNLSKTDVAGNMTLPKQEIESVLARINSATPDMLLNGHELITAEKLQNGHGVIVEDIMEGDEYNVILKCSNNTRYYFGEGWSTMKWSLDLEEGQELKLYWDVEDKRFYVLNFLYNILPQNVPV